MTYSPAEKRSASILAILTPILFLITTFELYHGEFKSIADLTASVFLLVTLVVYIYLIIFIFCIMYDAGDEVIHAPEHDGAMNEFYFYSVCLGIAFVATFTVAFYYGPLKLGKTDGLQLLVTIYAGPMSVLALVLGVAVLFRMAVNTRQCLLAQYATYREIWSPVVTEPRVSTPVDLEIQPLTLATSDWAMCDEV
jgi:hypothetical protein